MKMANNIPEVVVLLPELLDVQSRNRLIQGLEQKSDIRSATFCPIRHHLMLVQYERDDINSQDVLCYVREGGADARLVGAI
jgi:hypothetical protein